MAGHEMRLDCASMVSVGLDNPGRTLRDWVDPWGGEILRVMRAIPCDPRIIPGDDLRMLRHVEMAPKSFKGPWINP